jgi:hypothetical protein
MITKKPKMGFEKRAGEGLKSNAPERAPRDINPAQASKEQMDVSPQLST